MTNNGHFGQSTPDRCPDLGQIPQSKNPSKNPPPPRPVGVAVMEREVTLNTAFSLPTRCHAVVRVRLVVSPPLFCAVAAVAAFNVFLLLLGST